jgi:hypothetical protein
VFSCEYAIRGCRIFTLLANMASEWRKVPDVRVQRSCGGVAWRKGQIRGRRAAQLRASERCEAEPPSIGSKALAGSSALPRRSLWAQVSHIGPEGPTPRRILAGGNGPIRHQEGERSAIISVAGPPWRPLQVGYDVSKFERPSVAVGVSLLAKRE